MFGHKRIRIQNNKIEEISPKYGAPYTKENGFSDIRIAEIPRAAQILSELVHKARGTVPSIGKELAVKNPGATIIGINASFVELKTGTLLGKTIIKGKVVFPDVAGKTEKRPHLYSKKGVIGIGRIDEPTDIDWAVCGLSLVRGGKYVFPVSAEKVPSDIANGRNQRTTVGLNTKCGLMGIMLADEGQSDAGLSQLEVAEYFISRGYDEVIVLDGGGSSTVYSNDTDLQYLLDLKDGYHVCETGNGPRAVSHVLAFILNKDLLFPKPIFGIDCATPLTDKTAKALAAEGVKFVCRYLTLEKFAWKRLTSDEVKLITDAGMKMVTVWETTANRSSGGTASGKVDGAAALREAKTVGQPPGAVIFFAVDYDAQAKDYNAIEQYLRAAAAEIQGYTIGVYGSFAVVQEMVRRDACKHFWQTYAWSKGQKSTWADMYQYNNDTKLAGMSLDLNEAYNEECFWTPRPDEKQLPVIQKKVGLIVDGEQWVGGYLINNESYVPARSIAQALGCEVGWDGENILIKRRGN